MPRITKGAKYVFGWSKVRDDGSIVIPGEASDEYGLQADTRIILVSGSRTSGGFGITSQRLLEGSRLGTILPANRELVNFEIPEGKTIEIKGRHYGWASLHGNTFRLGHDALKSFGVKAGERLLAIRASHIAIGMAVRGPIVEAASEHSEIEEY